MSSLAEAKAVVIEQLGVKRELKLGDVVAVLAAEDLLELVLLGEDLGSPTLVSKPRWMAH